MFVYVEVRRFTRVDSLLQSCGPQLFNSGCHAWGQVLFPAESSLWFILQLASSYIIIFGNPDRKSSSTLAPSDIHQLWKVSRILNNLM